GLCRASLSRHGLRVSQHFFDRRVACKDAAQTVLTQRNHSKLDRLLLYGYGRRAVVDQFAGRIRNLQEFVNSFSSSVAGVVASLATFAVEELFIANIVTRDAELRQQRIVRTVRGAAMTADAAQQSLTKDGL